MSGDEWQTFVLFTAEGVDAIELPLWHTAASWGENNPDTLRIEDEEGNVLWEPKKETIQ